MRQDTLIQELQAANDRLERSTPSQSPGSGSRARHRPGAHSRPPRGLAPPPRRGNLSMDAEHGTKFPRRSLPHNHPAKAKEQGNLPAEQSPGMTPAPPPGRKGKVTPCP